MSPLRTAVLSILIALAPTLRGAGKIDLQRVTPVPATETIPVADFFRPLILQQPVLNRAGTHIAAVITAGADHHQLLTYELKTQKVETVSAWGDRDISGVSWLDDRRLIFHLSARKMFGVGLMAADLGSLTHAYPLLQYYFSHVIAVPPERRLRPLVWNEYDGLDGGTRHDLGVSVVDTDVRIGHVVDLLSANAYHEQAIRLREENERHIIKTYPAPRGLHVLDYMADVDGNLDFSITAENGLMTLHHWTGKQWEKCPVDLEEIDIIGKGDRPGQLVVRGPRQEGKPRALQYLDGATGQLGDMLIEDKAYEFYGGGISDGWLYRDPDKTSHHRRRFRADRPPGGLVQRAVPRSSKNARCLLSRFGRAHPRQRSSRENISRRHLFRSPTGNLQLGQPGDSHSRTHQTRCALDRPRENEADGRGQSENPRRPASRRLPDTARRRVQSESAAAGCAVTWRSLGTGFVGF
jgi:hypothetical protein